MQSQSKTLTFGSLFAGIGGFDLGFARAGLECAYQVEWDKNCNRVLSAKFPSVERFEDVTTVECLPRVDVLCGGFPCQDLSVAGKRAGLAGERSGLWFAFLGIIERDKPRFVVIENVPGLLSSNGGEDFAIILRGLVKCGYGVAWRILDAQYFGVAQRRRRVFIVGSLGDGSAAEILFESEGVSGDSPPRRETRPGTPEVSVRRAQTSSNGWGVRTDGSTGTLDGTGGDAVIADCLTRNYGKQPDSSNRNAGPVNLVAATLDQRGRGPTDSVMMNLIYHENIDGKVYESPECPALRNFQKDAPMVTHALSSEGADASEDGTGRGTPLIAATLNSGGNNGGFRSEPGEHLISVDLQNTRIGGDIAGSLDTSRPSRGGGQAVFALQHAQIGRKDDAGPQGKGYQEDLAFTLDNRPSADVVAFEPRYYTRDNKTGGAPDEVVGITNAHKAGDSAPVVFESRVARNGRGAPSDIVPPLKAESGQTGKGDSAPLTAGKFGVRRLTPRECERLQGFPDDFTRYDANGKEISDSSRYRMLGNAVAVPCAEWIGKRIVEVERKSEHDNSERPTVPRVSSDLETKGNSTIVENSCLGTDS